MRVARLLLLLLLNLSLLLVPLRSSGAVAGSVAPGADGSAPLFSMSGCLQMQDDQRDSAICPANSQQGVAGNCCGVECGSCADLNFLALLQPLLRTSSLKAYPPVAVPHPLEPLPEQNLRPPPYSS